VWRLVILVLLSGCGLMLDADPEADAGGPYDSAVTDSAEVDAVDMDAPEVDTGMMSDGMAGDVPIVDGGPADSTLADVQPKILSGRFERDTVMIDAGEFDAAFAPLPFGPTVVKFQFNTLMDAALFMGDIYGPSGALGLVPGMSMTGGRSWITFAPTDPLDNGWYCVRVVATPSATGRLLDGEWAGSFPSGDGTEGGDFSYRFAVLQGDVDRDRDVDGDDYLAWQASDPNADFDGNGVIDGLDYDIWNENFGDTLDASAPDICPATPAPTP